MPCSGQIPGQKGIEMKSEKSWRGSCSRRHTSLVGQNGIDRSAKTGGNEMNENKPLITETVIDSNLVDAANCRAAKYIHDHKPQGVGFGEVRDDILKEFFLRREAFNAAAAKGDVVALGDLLEEAVSVALGDASNESHKHYRKLVPFQVRNADVYLQDKAFEDLALDMSDYFRRQSRRETEAWFVRCAIRHLCPSDQRIAKAYMEEGSWERVAFRFGRSEGDFRRHVLPGFVARFKEEWERCW